MDSIYRRFFLAEQYKFIFLLKFKLVRVQKRQQFFKYFVFVERIFFLQFNINDILMYEKVSQDVDVYVDSKIKLVICNNCGRKFVVDRLQRYKNVCGNVIKKRKVMDLIKMRVVGIEMENYVDSRNRFKIFSVNKQF